jgi:tetratricopeptide (TPR) repeat protein
LNVAGLDALRSRARRLFEDKAPAATDLGTETMERVNRRRDRAPAKPMTRWHNEAARRLELADWKGAEEAYRQAIDLSRTEHAGFQGSAHLRLCEFFLLLNRPAEAFESARTAVELLRGFGCAPFLQHALEILTRAAQSAGDLASAKSAVEESLRSAGPIGRKDLMWARAKVQRACCSLLENNLPGATQDLEEAEPVLGEKADQHSFAGYQSGLAQWWEAMADLRLRRRDLRGAVGAMQEAIRRRQIVVETPWITGPAKDAALAESLYKLGRLLRVEGKSRAAAAFVAQSEAVLAAVGLPSANRKSFQDLQETLRQLR